jgi:DNA-binding NarL/FixJ family response regulator
VRVVVAEDSGLLRDALGRLLSDYGIEVAASVGTVEELREVMGERPDVFVLDVRMPPTFTDEGIRAAAELRAVDPQVKVLVLSQYVEERYARDLFAERSDGLGYLLKDRVVDGAEFVDALRRVAAGGSVLDPEVVRQLLARHPTDQLSRREREVLGLMAEGRSNAGIAHALFLTEGAVEKHITGIFQKLRLAPAPDDHRRVLAVLAWLGAR